MMKNEEIFSISLDISEAIIRCGGEIHRAEDTIRRINAAYGNSCNVFAIPSLIIAQSDDNIQIRKIESEDTDLSELARLNALSRRLCYDYSEEINITQKKVYSTQLNILAICTATAAFCIFFKGTLTDAFFSSLTGVIITYAPYKKIGFANFTSNLIDSFIAGISAHIPFIVGINTHPDKIIIGAIMLLVPGLTVVNSMRDMMNGDLAAGLFELFSSIMSAFAIALGIAGAILILNKI